MSALSWLRARLWARDLPRCGWPHPGIPQWKCTRPLDHAEDRCQLRNRAGAVLASWPAPHARKERS